MIEPYKSSSERRLSEATEIPKILGVDFDETLFLDEYPDAITPNLPVVYYVWQKMKLGWYIILVTCRHTEADIREAITAAEKIGIKFDAINENHPGLVAKYGDCRKIYCDEYIDDKNVPYEKIEKLYYGGQNA